MSGPAGDLLPYFISLAVRGHAVLLFAMLAVWMSPNGVTQDVTDISGPAQFKILKRADIVREDLNRLSLGEARARAVAGNLAPARHSTGDPTHPNSLEQKGLIYGPVWARLVVTNGSDQELSARLDTRAAVLNNVLLAYVVRARGEDTMIWRNDWLGEPYEQQFPKMRLRGSRSFSLKPGEQVEIWIDYPHGFYLEEELWLINEDDFIDRRTSDAGYAAFFFGWRAALIIAVFAFAAVLKSRIAVYYGLFSASLFAFFLENYGFTYTYLFRSATLDQIWFIASGGLAFTFFGLMCRDFLNAPHLYPKLNKTLTWTMMAGWGLASISILAGPHPLSLLLLIPVVLSFVAICIYGAVLGVRNQHSGAVLFLMATLMLFANCLFGLFSWPPFYWVPVQVNVDVTHLGFSLDAFLFAGALVAQTLSLRRERDAAHAAQVVALEEKAKITTKLTAMSENYDRAVSLAEQRRIDLAATTHDLKQPLLSLQLSLKDRADVSAVSEGISYLQGVVDRALHETHPTRDEPASKAREAKTLNLSRVLQNVVVMFEDEAKSKGLVLSAAPTSLVVSVEPVILMRILTNLVANAVKHTAQGRILLGARRRGEHVCVEVYDTGAGIGPDQLQDIFKPYRAGEGSKGEGLGLSVVRDLAESHGLSVLVQSKTGHGSRFQVSAIARA